MRPLPVSFQVEHRGYRWSAGAGVITDGQISIHRRLIHREKIRIVQSVVAFNAAKKNSHGAVPLRAFDFLHGLFDRSQRWNDHPAQTIVTVSAGATHQAVGGATQRDLQLGVVRKIDQEQGRVHDLSLDAEPVHIGESGGYIGDLSTADTDVLARELDLRFRRSDQAEAALTNWFRKDISVDQPERVPILVERVIGNRDQDGSAMVHVGVYQVPHAWGFSDMGIRINYTLHLLPPGQAGEKGSSASLRSIVSPQRTAKSTPPLADFSRASQLKPFDEPAIEFVQESFLRNKAQIDQLLHR